VYETTIRPSRYPVAIWRNVRLVVYASPGLLMNVRALVSVATTENSIAHHGIFLPATK
jgi:hypothetical protein